MAAAREQDGVDGVDGDPGTPGDGGGRPVPGEGGGSGGRGVPWTTRAILAVVVLASAVAGWFVATAFLPRWWARHVADVVDGSPAAGLLAGLACGAAGTAVPLLLLRPALRRHAPAGARVAWLAAAALAAVPDLVTLGTVLGGNAAARDGGWIMDARAPWFRGATLAGAVLGAAAVAALWFVLGLLRRRSRELARLRAELRRRDEADALAGDRDPDDAEALDDIEDHDDLDDGDDRHAGDRGGPRRGDRR